MVSSEKMQRTNITLALLLTSLLAITSFGIGLQSSQVNEGIKVSGWVKVQVVRDGKIIYFYEGHNVFSNQGKDILYKQAFAGLGNGTVRTNLNNSMFIALTSWTGAANATQTQLTAEITTNGLQRAVGTTHHTNGTSTITIRKTFTASGSFTAVQEAGLFNDVTANKAGLMAVNTFSSVNLISGDQITITWTITLS